jgi:beta-N-acetylhexosaminidase
MRTAFLTVGAIALLAAIPAATDGGADPAKRASAADVGQRIVSGMTGTRPSASLLRRVRRGEVGGVILFGWNVSSTGQVRSAIAALQRAARRGGRPPLLTMTDQEGGSVKRFPSLPPFHSARRMGRDPALAEREGRRTGRALRAKSVNVNLAPVADVPHFAGNFLGARAFSTHADTAAAAASAFARGLAAGGVGATAKHFPGLGYARANTDYARVRIAASAGALRADYAPFAAAIAAGTPLVMISNASYAALDPSGLPACMSRPVVEGELRGRLGFTGVTISDALGSPAVTRVRDRYVRIANAGVDLLLFGTERASARAYRRLVAAARRGSLDARRNAAAAARIRLLRSRLRSGV